ncbi:polymorphic toxin-type HINT domain-containing protein [Streptomyces sp. NPDC093085]|uniref:polymorphic toxin-type HINT domain-containing protein n=1 Tax=Streptomyces sp. NPDC093085 TaxID=3155068 RepID=UPI0034239301
MTLVRALFALTVIGGAGALIATAPAGTMDARLLGLIAYAAAPGVAGLVLARRVWTGGVRVRWGLLAVQGWLLLGASGTLAEGGGHGPTQLLLPLATAALLCHPSSRDWFRLTPSARAPHRRFRLARMIRWRGDGGQTATEYLGLIAVVVALIGGLVATGVSGRITGGLQSAVCSLGGGMCLAPGQGDNGTDADVRAEERAPGDGAPGDVRAADGRGPVEDASRDSQEGRQEEKKGKGEERESEKADKADEAEKKGDDCGGWRVLSCGVEQVGGFFKGAVVDGLWGDVTGFFDTVTHPMDTLKGIGGYGELLAAQWEKDSRGAAGKWSDGDYFGAIWNWGKASSRTVDTIADDMLIGDEARDLWKNGEYGRAIGAVGWNIGSLFIPGYGETRLLSKAVRLGKYGRTGKPGGEALDRGARPGREAASGNSRKPDKTPSVCPASHSFLPDTPVLMADGSHRAIQDVRVGDKVTATDPLTGVTAGRPVTRTFITKDDKNFTRLTVRTGGPTHQLTATDTHPFWLPDRSLWEDAGEVRAGDRLMTSAGTSTQVTSVFRYVQRRTTYDLAVAGIHTYYVGIGSENVLVHNNNGCEWQAREDIPGPAAGLKLKRPNDRHYLRGVAHQKKPQAAKNTVILRGYEKQIDKDIEAIAQGRANLLRDGNRYEVGGRTYGVEETGRVYPESGPGMVEMDTHEYAALIEVAKHKGDVSASPQLNRNPRFTNHPERVSKAKEVYEGTYR